MVGKLEGVSKYFQHSSWTPELMQIFSFHCLQNCEEIHVNGTWCQYFSLCLSSCQNIFFSCPLAEGYQIGCSGVSEYFQLPCGFLWLFVEAPRDASRTHARTHRGKHIMGTILNKKSNRKQKTEGQEMQVARRHAGTLWELARRVNIGFKSHSTNRGGKQ